MNSVSKLSAVVKLICSAKVILCHKVDGCRQVLWLDDDLNSWKKTLAVVLVMFLSETYHCKVDRFLAKLSTTEMLMVT